jgi:hypothetical protein
MVQDPEAVQRDLYITFTIDNHTALNEIKNLYASVDLDLYKAIWEVILP